MPWQPRSRRRAELPPNWPTIRQQVLDRDQHWCQLHLQGCRATATDIHHTGAPNDHRLEVLTAACGHCHMSETARASHASRPPRQRTTPKHPGLI